MALKQAIVEKLGIDETELIKKLVTDIFEIFKTMVFIDDISYLPQEIEVSTHYTDSVTAMVGLAGTYNGIVCLHASKSLALRFTAHMLCMDEEEVDEDMSDALGEIVNMISGSFKRQLSKGGSDIQLSTPSVVTGSDYSFFAGNPGNTLALLLSTAGEEFIISIVLDTN